MKNFSKMTIEKTDGMFYSVTNCNRMKCLTVKTKEEEQIQNFIAQYFLMDFYKSLKNCDNMTVGKENIYDSTGKSDLQTF